MVGLIREEMYDGKDGYRAFGMDGGIIRKQTDFREYFIMSLG